MVKIIKASYPNLPVQEVNLNTKGWDNDVLIVNKDVVFRFPKTLEIRKKVLKEASILKLLKTKDPLVRIPNYELVYRDGEFVGVTYSYLKGSSLSECKEDNIHDNLDNAVLIGDFLTKLHTIDLSEIGDIGRIHTDAYWDNLYKSVKDHILPNINRSIQKEVEDLFEQFLCADQVPINTIIHGDLTTSNIIYNHEENVINGVIDFTDTQWGDPAFDFAGLYWSYGPGFTKEVLASYRTEEDKESLFERVQSFYGLQPIFHNVLFAIENNQTINWDTAFERFTYLHSFRSS